MFGKPPICSRLNTTKCFNSGILCISPLSSAVSASLPSTPKIRAFQTVTRVPFSPFLTCPPNWAADLLCEPVGRGITFLRGRHPQQNCVQTRVRATSYAVSRESDLGVPGSNLRGEALFKGGDDTVSYFLVDVPRWTGGSR